jgi:HlyD family secretion protein
MKHKRPPIPVIVLLGLIVLGVFGYGAWYLVAHPGATVADAWNALVNPGAQENGTIHASGTVETTEVNIAPEVGGKVEAMFANEGDAVKAGQVLFSFDDAILKSQRTIAAANLESARIALVQLTSPAAIHNLEKTIAQDKQDIDNAENSLNNQKYFTTNTDAILNARSSLTIAEKSLSDAKDTYATVSGDPSYSTDKANAYQQLYKAQTNYDNAVYLYNFWTGKIKSVQIDLKTAILDLANAKLAEDEALLEVLKGGPIARDASGVGIMQFQQAQLNVEVAQANLDLLDVQIAKLTVHSPADGVILQRNIQPGEVIQPGATAFVIGRLDEMTITVYVPEDRYGELILGQEARLSVDSFPGETFKAHITHIADQAEFTPRNVQTAEGRSNTVFAIKLQVEDPQGKIKPGMPADVEFK